MQAASLGAWKDVYSNLPSPLLFIPSTPALPAAAGISRPMPNIHPRDIPIDALPPLHSILGLQTPTLRHVPKGLRDVWATVVGEVLASLLASPNQIESWCKLFMLPKCILSSPPRGGCSHWRDVLSLVRSRIQKWRDGGICELWGNVTAEEKKLKARLSCPKSSGPSPESLCRGNAIRARRAVEDRQYKKVLQSLTSAGLVQPSNDVLAEMLAKHPISSIPTLPADPPPPPIQISKEEVSRALKSFPNGSAPGPSGLRSNHLKQAVFCPSPDRANHVFTCLTRLVNLLCAGKVPEGVIPHLCGASLLPCKKKAGGLRLIAVGEVLRHLTLKCAARSVQCIALKSLPLCSWGCMCQLGVKPLCTR